jgi:hypothetical protein
MKDIISRYFNNFTTMSEASHTAVVEIAEREVIEMDKIILSTSFCFDELNHHQAKMKLPITQGTFIMGGLAGYPFVGEIGLTAFADHIPDDGAALFIFGSHIGISGTGEVGKVKRTGQHRHTNTCGALMLVQDHILSDSVLEIHPNDYSGYQAEYLALRLSPMVADIRKAEVPILKTTHLVYDEIENEILKLIIRNKILQSNFPVYILGGIVINTDDNLPNYFAQKVFRKVN